MPSTFAAQPFQGTEIIAFVLALASVLYITLWLRDREPGMGAFAAGMMFMALWGFTIGSRAPTGPYFTFTRLNYSVVPALVLLALGLVTYLGMVGRARRVALVATAGPMLLYTVFVVYAVEFGANVPRIWANQCVGLTFLVMACVAWWGSRRERGAGHGFLALALALVPGLTLGLLLAGADPSLLRQWGALPLIVLAMTLLTVSLLRRRHALEAEVKRRTDAEAALNALNGSLEQTVAQRTADLQGIVAGLETFNRSISHDLRGPLGGIAGLARLAESALQGGDSTLALRTLPVIASQADGSAKLVAALLALARVGDVPLQLKSVALEALAHDVVDQLGVAAAGDALPDIEVGPMPVVQADPELIRAVFANLIGNAVKFTRGRAQAHVEVTATNDSGAVRVSVRDNGIGFDPAQAATVFEPFKRLHGVDVEGHGIGLSIVRRAVERHGGRVWAESVQGAGACFSFTLPMAAAVSPGA